MQEKSLKEISNELKLLLKDIIIDYDFNKLIIVEKILHTEADEFKDPIIVLTLTYIYFILLNETDRKVFVKIRKHVFNNIYTFFKIHLNKNGTENFMQENISQLPAEEKIMYYLTLQVFAEYSNDNEILKMFEPLKEKQIENFINVVFNTSFSKFNDANIIALILLTGERSKINISLSEMHHNLLSIILFNQIAGGLTATEEERNEEEDPFLNEIDKIELK